MSIANPLMLSEWRAMILAAGFGTRLKPLTDRLPKPLVPIAGVPMLVFSLKRFRKLKPRVLVVNGHHLSGQLEIFLHIPPHNLLKKQVKRFFKRAKVILPW